jgi:hypothetical protein
MKTLAIAAVIVAAAALSGEAQAARLSSMPGEAGTLNCTLDSSVGLVFGSVRRVDCQFDRYDRRGRLVRENYSGTMKRAGFDVGIAGRQAVSYRVTTMGGRAHRGMLAGAFDGSSAEASLVVGPGTHAIYGLDGDRVMLDPISQSEQLGMRLGFGATEIELARVPNVAFSSLR